ncbi:hypothetical protein SAMN04883147_1077244 [Streptomyces sp. DpondAA-F4]|nr:hypothetical protein SAMN04883147_1077244 [Streptomyces sp. DpondAA-F4]
MSKRSVARRRRRSISGTGIPRFSHPPDQLFSHHGVDELHLRVLHDEADGLGDLGEAGEVLQRASEDLDAAAHGRAVLVVGDDAGQALQEGGLPRAGRAENAQDLPGSDDEVDLVECAPLGALVADGQAGDGQCRCGHFMPLR